MAASSAASLREESNIAAFGEKPDGFSGDDIDAKFCVLDS
jgi:hypothetical protein